VLEILDEVDVKCTYFVEGWSSEVYPDQIKHLANRGHEVGYHGWMHEHWAGLSSEEEERKLIADGVAAIGELGIEMAGFRPPGGVMTAWTRKLSIEVGGFRYLSPAAARAGTLDDGLIVIPFSWKAIDAYYLFSKFRDLRTRSGDTPEVLSTETMVARMIGEIDRVVRERSALAILFHPFLLTDDDRLAAMREVLEHVKSRPEIWCSPCAAVAQWISDDPEIAAGDPEMQKESWK
jgi:peptidoglycan/xylan/chitin deacetylase (PgdA/CDA1 family)